MSKDFFEALMERRSDYGISSQEVVPYEKLREVIDFGVKHTPTAFNSQGGRVALLLGEHHDKLWDITLEQLRKIVPADKFEETNKKIQSFKAGFGTILFFDDESVVKGLQESFPIFKDNFPTWAQQANGMLQLVIWTGLRQIGYGASLQHYNELIEDAVRESFSIEPSWKMVAQMPFGKPGTEMKEKAFEPVDKRIVVYK
ncbi:MAG: nitroreductase family protein [Defluviitaleaceae bacterium]|nr:nitroreductase family protein [Defluviitaleaceae bacterium]